MPATIPAMADSIPAMPTMPDMVLLQKYNIRPCRVVIQNMTRHDIEYEIRKLRLKRKAKDEARKNIKRCSFFWQILATSTTTPNMTSTTTCQNQSFQNMADQKQSCQNQSFQSQSFDLKMMMNMAIHQIKVF